MPQPILEEPMTLHDQLCAGLLALGCAPAEARGTCYSVFSNALPVFSDAHWYVGANGALRRGDTAGRSHPCSERVRRTVLAAGLHARAMGVA